MTVMNVDEALKYADDQIAGTTFYEGTCDIVVALALLASEVRRLRKFTKPKYKLSDLLAERDTDAPIPEALRAWIEMQTVGKERDDELGVLADAAKASANRTSDAIDETLTFVEESNKRIKAMELKSVKKKVSNPTSNKLNFESFKYQVVQLILIECPGRSTATINDLIDRNIVEFCADFFNGLPIEDTAKNIMFTELFKLTA